MSTDQKRCSQCLQERPLTEFRRRAKGLPERLNQCRPCHAKAERMRRRRLKLKRDSAALAGFASELKSVHHPGQVAALVESTFASFGGAARFMERWALYTKRLATDAPMSKRHSDVFLAILRALEWLELNRPSASELSDEELERQKMQAIERDIRSRPELAIQAATQLGWTVVPSSDCGGRVT